MEPDVFDAKLRFPGSMCIFAKSQSGKTELVFKMLKNRQQVWNRTIPRIYYVYSVFSPRFDEIKAEMPEINFLTSFRDVPETGGEPTIIVHDDKQLDYETNKEELNYLLSVFFKGCHHSNIFFICTFQTIFTQNPGLRKVFLNSVYHVVFFNQRDQRTLDRLNTQIFPESRSLLRTAMRVASQEPFAFLLIDCSQQAHINFRIRNFVFPTANALVFSALNVEYPGSRKVLPYTVETESHRQKKNH